eukprot:Rhum_TRINITY_DN4453_c0_g1::Rhum_TRINITY_DN4453_c0_g1_i1::g.14409::m.14409
MFSSLPFEHSSGSRRDAGGGHSLPTAAPCSSAVASLRRRPVDNAAAASRCRTAAGDGGRHSRTAAGLDRFPPRLGVAAFAGGGARSGEDTCGTCTVVVQLHVLCGTRSGDAHRAVPRLHQLVHGLTQGEDRSRVLLVADKGTQRPAKDGADVLVVLRAEVPLLRRRVAGNDGKRVASHQGGFDGVAQPDTELLPHNHPSCALLRALHFERRVLRCERGCGLLHKQGQHLLEHKGGRRRHAFAHRVAAVDEEVLVLAVPVEVGEQQHITTLGVLDVPDQVLVVEDGRRQARRRRHPLAVEVAAAEGAAVVAVDDAVRVQHRDDLEHQVVAEVPCFRVGRVHERVKEALEDPRGTRLSGVHAGAEEANLPLRNLCGGDLCAVVALHGCDREEVDVVAAHALAQHLLPRVVRQLWVLHWKMPKVALQVRVRVRVAVCDVARVVRVRTHHGEGQRVVAALCPRVQLLPRRRRSCRRRRLPAWLCVVVGAAERRVGGRVGRGASRLLRGGVGRFVSLVA